jgi:hypothetical protein
MTIVCGLIDRLSPIHTSQSYVSRFLSRPLSPTSIERKVEEMNDGLNAMI